MLLHVESLVVAPELPDTPEEVPLEFWELLGSEAALPEAPEELLDEVCA